MYQDLLLQNLHFHYPQINLLLYFQLLHLLPLM
jgi:hypothetical protein